tara:strand:+ start:176 stop:550 length:375 start_codon:yes stop_codon:yes gene_type:complete
LKQSSGHLATERLFKNNKYFMKKIIFLLTLLSFVVSCANPTVVNVIGPNDNKLSCEELSSEIAKANKYSDEAQAAKKAGKPHNVGAVLFFLPGLGFSMANIDEATKAAKERAIHLNKLKEKKNC